MPATEVNYLDHDHRAHLSCIRAGISDLKSATTIMHSLVHNDGDENQLRWMANKLLDDACNLEKEFAEKLEACIGPWMQQAAE